MTAAHVEGPSREKAEDQVSCSHHDLQWTSSIRSGLGQLLAWSHDAKSAALGAGLLEAIMQAVHMHLGKINAFCNSLSAGER